MLKDERAQISIDFLAGLALFMLTLLFLVQFIPGMFVPFQTETIDLSSVAYRTSVILAEDPGWWDDGTDKGEDWETTDEHIANVSRVGLAIDKEHPNMLTLSKIDVFKNSTLIDDASLTDKLGLYRTIGGNRIDYRYNIKIEDLNGNILATRGDLVPESGDVSSMKRLVKAQTGTQIILEWDELEGDPPANTKALFNITAPEEDVTIVIEDILLKIPPNAPVMQCIKWDDDSDGNLVPANKLEMGTDADPYDYKVWMDNRTGFVQQASTKPGPPWTDPDIDLPPSPYNATSRLKITISKDALNTNPGVINQLEVNFRGVEFNKKGCINLDELEKVPEYYNAILEVKIWT